MRKLALLCLLVTSLTACSWSNFPFLYKPDIQQGNVLPDDRVAQLKLGMNKDEVIYLLGNPVLTQVFVDQQTIYVYTMKVGKGKMKEQKLLLTFVNDKLTQIDKQ